MWRVPFSGGAPARVEVFAQGLTQPAISRRGDRLAWTHTSIDTNIWRVEAHAEGPQPPRHQLIASTMADTNPQFSDDGQRIVFTSTRSGETEIWVADSKGKLRFA